MNTWDAIVLGVGGAGSAVLRELAVRGASVLGVDRFAPGHERGSSHGATRIIRLAYMEHPDYVPLLRRAFTAWEELSERRGLELYRETGLLEVGPPDGPVVSGVLESARLHDLDVDEMTASEAEARFPGLRLPKSLAAVYEKRAGILRVEECIAAMVDEAVAAGAELAVGGAVESWSAEGGEVRVRTPGGEHVARRLIVTAGAWAGEVLADLDLPLEVRRKPLYWFDTPTDAYDIDRGFPVFLVEMPTGVFYGFPRLDERGIKVADHAGGERVDDPLALDREVDEDDLATVRDFVRICLPAANLDINHHTACMYTMTPDENFIVGRHPRREGVLLVAGLSGHGFKLVPVLGAALADLALEGATELPIAFLSPERETLRGGGQDA